MPDNVYGRENPRPREIAERRGPNVRQAVLAYDPVTAERWRCAPRGHGARRYEWRTAENAAIRKEPTVKRSAVAVATTGRRGQLGGDIVAAHIVQTS
jgi:hypothetical protein